MPDPACYFCHGAQTPRIRLNQEEGDEILTVCPPCLRSNLVMKAALSEPRSVRLLRQDAQEYGLHLWRSRYAAYLLPTNPTAGVAAKPAPAAR